MKDCFEQIHNKSYGKGKNDKKFHYIKTPISKEPTPNNNNPPTKDNISSIIKLPSTKINIYNKPKISQSKLIQKIIYQNLDIHNSIPEISNHLIINNLIFSKGTHLSYF